MPLAGDDLVEPADVVMDSAFTLLAPPELVWPWLQQLGKRRAGWYLSRGIEAVLPPGRRAIRRIDDRWQHLGVGDVIPDYGGADATFAVAEIAPPSHLVYTSQRGRTAISWSLNLAPIDLVTAGPAPSDLSSGSTASRVRIRLRLAGIERPRLVRHLGGAVDRLTIAGMATGLQQRLDDHSRTRTAGRR
jgi:hypothetical protein